ncbi:unnamed protein product [Owenia fusiformis]|uniref:Uncharacterized protein n=1 Tax=Owenia fusiformis TaxID=6347 RepID=A0A8J1TDD2_OWEFU|nr:unnamed protein product [Owenia fusiformis]
MISYSRWTTKRHSCTFSQIVLSFVVYNVALFSLISYKGTKWKEKSSIKVRTFLEKDDSIPGSRVDSLCESSPQIPDGFTLVILNHNRTDTLLNGLKHWDHVRNIKKVLVVWNNPGVKIPDDESIRTASPHLDIAFLPQNTNSLNNRFRVFSHILTEAVLMMNDDCIVEDDYVQMALQAWQTMPYCIVGFHGRGVSASYQYQWNPAKNYSMVLNVGFLHREYLKMYQNAPPELLDIVDKYTNCEDILMNFLIANHTGSFSGVLVETPHGVQSVFSTHKSLSIRPDHADQRTKCIRQFVEYFGYLPLKGNPFIIAPYNAFAHLKRQ